MPTPSRSRLTDALFGVAAMFVMGCGQGIFDHPRVSDDAGETSDAEQAPLTGPEAGPPDDPDLGATAGPEAGRPEGSDAYAYTDAGPDVPAAADADPDAGNSQSWDVGPNGAVLTFGDATLTIGAGTFQSPVQVTLRKRLAIGYAGAYGTVFEIEVPSAGLFRKDAKLTLKTPQPTIASQANLVLGTLDPNLSLANQQWVWVSDSILSADQTSVTGSVTGFGNASVLDYAVVLRCADQSVCRSGEGCNAGVCQQCPTVSGCAP
ncbi:MAG TPA: hypothetical protein VIM14_05335 [Polyangia bacterium]